MKSRSLAAASLLFVPCVLAQPALRGEAPLLVKGSALESAGRIEAVTVYRGQALVTRVVDLSAKGLAEAAGGVREIVVTDLPPRVRAESLHAEASPNIKVRSVSFRARPVVEDTREEVRKLDSRIEQIQDQLAANRRRQDLLNEHRAYLAGLQNFVAPTATTELTKGVLNAETLQKLSDFIRTGRDEMVTRELQLNAEAKGLQQQLELAQRERQRLTSGSSRTVNEAVILAEQEGDGTLRLRYLVDGASWEPSYAARAASGADENRSAFTLEYFASIQQMSGEDWNDVAMTLSTATPLLVARAPSLSPIPISLAMNAQQPGGQIAYAEARKDLFDRQREAEQARSNTAVTFKQAGGGGEKKEGEWLDKGLNDLALQMQILDLVANTRVTRDSQTINRASEEGLSVTYTIPNRASLPSRADHQQILVASVPLKATFAKIAAPVLTGYVYDEAAAVNSSNLVLLAGPLTAYADGAFVGGGDLPTTASGQGLTAGFGIDSSLRTRRELVERTETIQGGNRVVELTYRLTVENFGGSPAAIRLLDRLPKVEANRSDIRLTVLSTGQALSEDAEYVAGPRKDGILRWDIAVPPQATGQQAFSLEYKYRLEYDKQMSIVGMGG